jgi:hypothetical protein
MASISASNENAINRLVSYIDKNRYSADASILTKVKFARETLQRNMVQTS